MKVFWVLTWVQYYPAGDLGNVDSTWETREEAETRVKQLKDDPDCYYDYIKIEDISEMLG